ncbi:hypothetical protein HOLleu_37191 [Holothuria leucospilota]|uniref:Uncharacterized protein n=1 Tax=Holothuria leucospilota TaxID=206669 RepID=A0A9Q1BC61_HOLLE|nr:hypothetical protein HOLleu_37191 [Holothuria leucospilota]
MTIREEIVSQVVSATLEMENVSINNLEEDSAVIFRFTTTDRLDVTTHLPKYLDYITWIGSSLSVIGLIACIMTLTCVK